MSEITATQDPMTRKSEISYNRSMGLKSHAQSEGFSADLNAYLKHIINGHGRDDLSGRWLTEITHSARARDYWSKLIKNERAMTTNDIDVLAGTFGMSPFEFVRRARELAEGNEVEVPNVAPHPEDYESSEDPGEALPNAAAEKRTPGS